MKKKMIIIGAGAAGMMTAIHASENYDVTIIEKNEKPGKKLYITGKGRCNVTNASDEETFLKNVISNPRFLYSAIYSYNQEAVMRDFKKWGVPLKLERGNRVFPASDRSSDVIKALENQLRKRKVKILYNTPVNKLLYDRYESDDEKEKYAYKVMGVELPGDKVMGADTIVIATGGLSYPLTGSTGDGLRLIKRFGIDVNDPRPALVPLETREKSVADMMGLSLKNVTVKVIARREKYPALKKDKVLYEDFGEMLFTHFGVSGPLCLSASSYISSFIYSKKNRLGDGSVPEINLDMEIDLKPALTEEELDRRVLRDFEEFRNRDFQNALGKLLPRLMIPVVVERSYIKPDKKVNEITAEERKRLIRTLKSFKLTVTGMRGFDEAIISGGGISVKEINPQNMELKKVKNLRVAGEIIDCDALTGGFNLQIAWSTAYMASNL
ncbi:MAG: NAD(P)/FAD-dependent oxidoreductase [Eubacterium sp.]|nr:NAD(P)/FAD-dependent oxidoreductase [Eubacterium sp.]